MKLLKGNQTNKTVFLTTLMVVSKVKTDNYVQKIVTFTLLRF